jgi:hypothetical protein
MPVKSKREQCELKALVLEQRKDRTGHFVYPERITPRRDALFSGLPNRESDCVILSIYKPRRQVAKSLGLTPLSVSTYLKRAFSKMLSTELTYYRRLKRLTGEWKRINFDID